MTQKPEIFPDHFFQIIDSGWFEDDGGIEFISFEYTEDSITIQFILHSGDEEIANQMWQLQVGNLKAHKIVPVFTSVISYYTDHFLLWEFTDRQTSLYFTNKAENPDKLLADIFRFHRQHFDTYIEIDRYINHCMDFSSLCHSDLGLFAIGPKQILTGYYTCLTNHNMNPYFQSDYEPAYTDSMKPLGVLILGESYFIGQDFMLKQISKL